MLTKFSIFSRMIFLIIVLLIPILILYGFFYKVSISVVQKEIASSDINNLTFIVGQVESEMEQLTILLSTIMEDSSIRQFQSIFFIHKKELDKVNTKINILEKLRIQSLSSKWNNNLSIYSPSLQDVLSTAAYSEYDASYLRHNFTLGWKFGKKLIDGREKKVFTKFLPDPYFYADQLHKAKLIIEVSVPISNFVEILDQFKAGGKGDPFFYHPEHRVVSNKSFNNRLSSDLILYLDNQTLEDSGSQVVRLDHEEYLVSYVKSNELGWHLVNYVPLQESLSPIANSRNLFYFSIVLLLFLSLLASFMLYRYVQFPIRKLIKGVLKVKDGNYSIRIQQKGNNEFDFLYTAFNEMAATIQNLVEKVFAEKISSREAKLKQLQSQIDPHFLYNCLAFIISMANLRNYQGITAMAHNLGKYYRYTTRTEKSTAAIREEIELIRNYLTIQKLRKPQLEFVIDIPEQMLELEVPRLLFQPIVENSIIHGLEGSSLNGMISIVGRQAEDRNEIVFDDNGIGLSPDELERLNKKIKAPLNEEIGFGVWNVYHRLLYHFGDGTDMQFSASPLGGLRVVMRWIHHGN
jgi:two-component system sensor histidine kinase YesM